MPRLAKEKIEKMQQLYESGKYSDIEIAAKVGVDKITVTKQAKKFGWTQEIKIPEQIEDQANQIIKASDSKDATVLSTANKLLPKLTEIIEKTLDRWKTEMDKKNGKLPPIRDLTNLLTKLMEIKGKLSGEFDSVEGADQKRLVAFERLGKMLDVLEGKNIKQISTNVDVIEVKGEIIDSSGFTASVVDTEIA